MKLIIEQEWDPSYYSSSEKDQERLYNKYYKNKGWLFDKEVDAIYYEVEIPFMPVEGQRLGTKRGISIVKYAIYETEQKEDSTYFNRSRIIIVDE
jgi:hypothetical protein